jgi:hypothetical protein
MAKPKIGDIVLINKQYFEHNVLISQYFPELKPGVPYTIKSIAILIDDIWGIDKLENTETGEIVDISTVDELKDYWCLLDADDSYRIIPQQ